MEFIIKMRQNSHHCSDILKNCQKTFEIDTDIKSMLICVFFWHCKHIMHKKLTTIGQAVNGHFYCDILMRLKESIQVKPPDQWMGSQL